ncbi:MAG: tellurite resistance protein TehA-like permease [Paraglaciecola psychrophila]
MIPPAINALINDQKKTYKLFALGALLFFIGIGIIQWAYKVLPPSLEQEAYVLLGIGVAGLGFCTSILAQLALIVFRLRKPRRSTTERRPNRRRR